MKAESHIQRESTYSKIRRPRHKKPFREKRGFFWRPVTLFAADSSLLPERPIDAAHKLRGTSRAKEARSMNVLSSRNRSCFILSGLLALTALGAAAPALSQELNGAAHKKNS